MDANRIEAVTATLDATALFRNAVSEAAYHMLQYRTLKTEIGDLKGRNQYSAGWALENLATTHRLSAYSMMRPFRSQFRFRAFRIREQNESAEITQIAGVYTS